MHYVASSIGALQVCVVEPSSPLSQCGVDKLGFGCWSAERRQGAFLYEYLSCLATVGNEGGTPWLLRVLRISVYSFKFALSSCLLMNWLSSSADMKLHAESLLQLSTECHSQVERFVKKTFTRSLHRRHPDHGTERRSRNKAPGACGAVESPHRSWSNILSIVVLVLPPTFNSSTNTLACRPWSSSQWLFIVHKTFVS